MLHGLFAGILAQTCAALLPLPQAEIEWFRDGQPYARDVPVSESPTERVYRRQLENGRNIERVVACTTARNVTYLVDRVGDATQVRLPVALALNAVRTVGGATIRRIEPPAGAARGALWFTVSSPGIAVYGVQRLNGIIEIRTPAPSGGFSIMRGVRRDPPPAVPVDTAVADLELERALRERIALLEITQLTLRDSLTRLRDALVSARAVPYSSPDLAELTAVDVYVERGEYQAAIALLVGVGRRLQAWSDSTGTRHRALDPLDARLHQVLAACAAAAAAPRPRRSRPITCTLDSGHD